jgi:endonuclease-3
MNYERKDDTMIELSHSFFEDLRASVAHAELPLVDQMIEQHGKNPFIILISCLLSLRARDVVTIHVCKDLFSRIKTPQQLLALPIEELETIIYKTGYYKTKAKTLRTVSQLLIDKHNSMVPANKEELIALPGVGLKTANLVLGLAYDVPAICVDTHVHRISNIWGLVQTKTPDETEEALKTVLPQEYWIEWNRLLVMLGQSTCTPPRPKCSQCPLRSLCPRIGVVKSR